MQSYTLQSPNHSVLEQISNRIMGRLIAITTLSDQNLRDIECPKRKALQLLWMTSRAKVSYQRLPQLASFREILLQKVIFNKLWLQARGQIGYPTRILIQKDYKTLGGYPTLILTSSLGGPALMKSLSTRIQNTKSR
eukprot:UN26513